jgi:hypothetical protein
MRDDGEGVLMFCSECSMTEDLPHLDGCSRGYRRAMAAAFMSEIVEESPRTRSTPELLTDISALRAELASRSGARAA